MFQLRAKLLYNKRVKENYFHLAIAAAAIGKKAVPGQFVQIRLSEGWQPFLRRPFSIHKATRASIDILYAMVGPGTEILSQKKTGEYLDVIGPLGNGFEFESESRRVTGSQILVAGGMGVAPLVFLAERLASSRSLVLIGAKNKKHILCMQEFQQLGREVKIATDDGSQGFKGYVSDLLNKTLSTIDHRPSAIYACGPEPMLKKINQLSRKYNIPAWVSLEEHMACGIGACLGCVVSTTEGYKRVCKEGPVFNASKINWQRA